jgi:hypothetical protein
MFFRIGFYVKQILEIVGSQIEIEKIFFLTKTFISFKRCHLQFKFGQIDFYWQKLAQWS